MRSATKLPLIHPGEILRDEIEERGLTLHAAAEALHVSPARIRAIVNGKRGITADTALRLGKYFGTSAQMWMNLQSAYDLAVVQRAVGDQIDVEVKLSA